MTTTMLTLAPSAPAPAHAAYAPSSSSSSSSSSAAAASARAVRPLPRKQQSFASVAASPHGTPSASSSRSASHSGAPVPRTSTPRAASGPVASSSRAWSATTPPAEPELRPSPAPAAPAAAPHVPEPEPGAVDIHTYNAHELLRLLASLLTQIATTNDALPGAPADAAAAGAGKPPIWHSLTTASRASLGTPSTALSFHARNVPTIALEAYLLRILKYCPTTNEVFLALLVYFDRMSKLVGDATGRTFVIDSFNVHRLVIAGVTVASKFFSDVFYTNSRYAKVGGLPLAELNQLELQFLLLNDFRLTVHPAEMQRYADQLVRFSASAPPPHAPAPAKPSNQLPAAFAGADASAWFRPEDDGASECGTEADASTEGGETDDEPTIRADRSECGWRTDDD